MGLFDFLNPDRAQREERPAHWGSLPKLEGNQYFDVVGESHYQESFRRIARKLGKGPGDEYLGALVLVANPDNPHSPSGKAVAVYCHGYHIGHIPESYAPTFFDKLVQNGGSAQAMGRIWFDNISRDFSRSSVSIMTEIPPRFEGEDKPLGYQVSHTYYLKYSKETQKKIDALYDARLIQGPGEVPAITELKRVFLSALPVGDSDLVKQSLKKQGISIYEVKSRKDGAQLVIVGENAIGDSVWTAKALLNAVEIVTITEFFSLYPELAPKSEIWSARRRYIEWLEGMNGLRDSLGIFQIDSLVSAMKSGAILIPGNWYSGHPELQIGLYEEENYSKSIFSNSRKDLFLELDGQPFDSIIMKGKLGNPTENGVEVLYAGAPVCLTGKETLDFFSQLKRGEEVLLQFDWLPSGKLACRFELVRGQQIFGEFMQHVGMLQMASLEALIEKKTGK